MYKAIIDVGGYKIGEEVPEERALVWLEMYSIPHVEKVSEDATRQDSDLEPEEKKESEPEGKPSENVMLDDYLGRNTNVVKKNIEEDNLSQEQLKGLLELEKSEKDRKVVIEAIKKKLID